MPPPRIPQKRVQRHPQNQPLKPYRTPTLTISNATVDLGDATLTTTGDGTYRAEVTIPTDGAWTAQVSVVLDEFTNPVARVAFRL